MRYIFTRFVKEVKVLSQSRFSGLFLLAVMGGVALVIVAATGGLQGKASGGASTAQNYGVANVNLDPFYVEPGASKTSTSLSTSTNNTGDVKAVTTSAGAACSAMCTGAGEINTSVDFTPLCQDKVENKTDVTKADSTENSGGFVIPKYKTEIKILNFSWNFAAMRSSGYTKIPNYNCEIIDTADATRNAAYMSSNPYEANLVKTGQNEIPRDLQKVTFELQGGTGKQEQNVNIWDIYTKACIGEQATFQGAGSSNYMFSYLSSKLEFQLLAVRTLYVRALCQAANRYSATVQYTKFRAQVVRRVLLSQNQT